MYIYIYIYIYVCIYVYIYIYMYMYMYICIYTHNPYILTIFVRMHVCIFIVCTVKKRLQKVNDAVHNYAVHM